MIYNHTIPMECNGNLGIYCIKNTQPGPKANLSNHDSGSALKEKDDKLIHFIDFSCKYCIGFIDIINSTLETSKIKESKKIKKYYSLFLNSMGHVITQHNGKIIKNSGDNIFFYFPKTADPDNDTSLQDVFNCSDSLIRSNIALNAELLQDNLPSINYRISMDYGLVEVALSSNRNDVDLFGSVVNECVKINKVSNTTGVVIGENLKELLIKSSFSHVYEIKQIQTPFKSSNKHHYRLYFISKKATKILSSISYNHFNDDYPDLVDYRSK